MVNCSDVTYGREGENYAISEGWGGLVGVVCIIVKLILNINFFLKQNMAFRQNFIYKVKGIFAVSVLFCSRTSSALITTRPEVLPSLHRALFTSRHGRPPFMGLPMAPNARCGRGRPCYTARGGPRSYLVPFCASGSGPNVGRGNDG